MVGLSIIVPTTDRHTLRATIDSVLSQATPLDELIVVFDGGYDMEPTYERVKDGPCDWVLSRIENRGCYGHAARNYALDHIVTRPRVMSIDDDDVYLPGAFDAVRKAVEATPPAVHVFGMRFGAGHELHGVSMPQKATATLRANGRLRGEVGTPMIVAPACTARFGTKVDDEFWELGPGYLGDLDYALALKEIFGSFVWHDTVIAEIRPVAAEVPA